MSLVQKIFQTFEDSAGEAKANKDKDMCVDGDNDIVLATS